MRLKAIATQKKALQTNFMVRCEGLAMDHDDLPDAGSITDQSRPMTWKLL
jgi:hypothetical protein